MALIKKGVSASAVASETPKVKPINKVANLTSNNSLDKRRKRTLAKQQQLSETISNISSELVAKTQEAVSAVEELKSAMEQIAAAAEQNAGAAEESLAAVNEIQSNTKMIVTDANHTINTLNEGQRVLDTTMYGLEDSVKRTIQSSRIAQEIADKSNGLKKASDNIGNSVGIIAEAAEQTNLLALNAAIEAARAKEHGKGFAVVADETRALAEISSNNAEATKKVVTDIQQSVDKVSKNIIEVKNSIEKAVENGNIILDTKEELTNFTKILVSNLNTSGQKLESLLSEVELMLSGSQAVASAAEEQSSAVNEATSAVEEQVSALSESEQAATSLSEIAEDIKNSTDVSKDAEEVASMAEELSSTIEQISGNIGQIVIALGEIEKAAALAKDDAEKNGAVAKECVKYVDDVVELLEDTTKNSKLLKDGLIEVVNNLKNIIDIINKSLSDGKVTTLEMDKVEKYAKQINKILRKIENVVTQTTMLAVSGNIEAARAGEFGKGFAVVSSDIRNLALESGNNIEKIVDTMAELDEEIITIIRDWADSVKEQNDVAFRLNELMNDMDDVVGEVTKIEELVENLHRATAQNKEALEEATEGAEQIILAAAQAESNANESKAAASMIQDIMDRMRELVEELAVAADELQQ